MNQCQVTESRRVYEPHVKVVDNPDAIELVAEVPGADENSTELSIKNDLLTVKARVATSELPGHRLVYSEYGTGDYERTFRLSDAIDRSRIEATVKHGVLRIRLPKLENAVDKKIPVLAG